MAAEPTVTQLWFGIDLSSYNFIYISYGSKQNEIETEIRYGTKSTKKFYQQCPHFLSYLHTLPLLCISIDTYDKFTIESRVIDLLDGGDTTYKHVCVPTINMTTTIEHTDTLVTALKGTKSIVFFVNFIKFKTEGNLDEQHTLKQSKKLPKLIPVQYNYYEWCGYSMPDFILKRNYDKDQLLEIWKDNKILEALNDDTKLKKCLTARNALGKYNDIRSGLLNITYDVTTDQIEYIPGSLAEREKIERETIEREKEGGTKKRKRFRKKRKSRKFK